MKWLVLTVVLFGCGAYPPDSIAIDPKFTDSQAIIIEDAIESWCDAVGWCPRVTRVGHAEAHISLVTKITDHEGYEKANCPKGECFLSGWNYLPDIQISDRVVSDLDHLWVVVAHELGHYCTGHTLSGLMSREQSGEEEMIIDSVAIAAWNYRCN
jgi:hypothetical protein